MIVGLVATGVVVLIFWLIRRNRRDRRDFEQTLNASERNPEKHENDEG